MAEHLKARPSTDASQDKIKALISTANWPALSPNLWAQLFMLSISYTNATHTNAQLEAQNILNLICYPA